jgi:hypothetical protein
MLMIAASCDILQDTFSSVTGLSRPVREPSVGYAHVMGCIVLLYVRVESSPSGWVCPCDGFIVLLVISSNKSIKIFNLR